MTWKELKEKVDKQLAELETDDGIEISYFTVDFVNINMIDIEIDSDGKLLVY